MKTPTKEIKTVEIHGRMIDVQDGGRCWRCAFIGASGRRIGRREIKFTSNGCGYLICGIAEGGKQRNVTQHELVALAYIGSRPDGHQIDHIDGDVLRNWSENLRYVTKSENLKAYRRKKSVGTSKYRGVSWSAKAGAWAAVGCRLHGGSQHLGYFATEAEAAIAFNEFAKLNGYLPEALNKITI